jgi:hypothetical protein
MRNNIIFVMFFMFHFLGQANMVQAKNNEDAPARTMKKIMETWKKNEKSVQSAIFEWTEKRVQNKTLLDPEGMNVEPDTPECDVISRLSFEKNMVRYSFRKSIWPDNAPQNKNQYVSVFNGMKSKVYFPPGYTTKYPTGYSSKKNNSEELTAVYLKPFLWSFRPFLPRTLPAELKKFNLLPETNLFQGRECLVLQYMPTTENKIEIWIDPSKGYSIVRKLFTNGDQIGSQLDIDYLFDAKSEIWIPEEWKYSLLHHTGVPMMTTNGKLKKHQINVRLYKDEFEFAFPEGTRVHEGMNTLYIVKANGLKQLVPMAKRNLLHDDILRDKDFKLTPRLLMVWGNVILFLISGVLLILYQIRAKQT